MTSLTARLWPALLALALGCAAAIAMLTVALNSEFPLFAEASAARGRDCATIRSARHALDPALQMHLAALAPHPVEAGTGIQDAVAAFESETSDIGTASVATALGEVDRRLDELATAVGGAALAQDPADAIATATRAQADVQAAWEGAIARVCA
ncbi:transporter [Leifsonia sp. fls2-241-R2A-40a]|uniref:transporter n=1 Tax=Leifsonia sp. fls2-241-R2A-40a TaxID=3040290 RepID=UPI00254BE6A7|nr:transporter [Leifsonia sp. fls2-241-R2A-40a]